MEKFKVRNLRNKSFGIHWTWIVNWPFFRSFGCSGKQSIGIIHQRQHLSKFITLNFMRNISCTDSWSSQQGLHCVFVSVYMRVNEWFRSFLLQGMWMWTFWQFHSSSFWFPPNFLSLVSLSLWFLTFCLFFCVSLLLILSPVYFPSLSDPIPFMPFSPRLSSFFHPLHIL